MVNKEPARFELFVQCPPGLERLLSREIASVSRNQIQRIQGGISTEGDMGTLVRINLHSALATRVLVRIASFAVHHLAQLDKKSTKIDWRPWISSGARVSVRATCSKSSIYHTKAAAQRVQNAVLQCVEALACPPKENPDVLINVRINRDVCTISIDSSGQALWRRGEKRETSVAPIRPNLAAAALQLANFQAGEILLDPMCGSGTIIIEALRMLTGLPPGLGRSFAFEKWPVFKGEELEKELNRIGSTIKADKPISLFGSDLSPGAVGMTRRNLRRIGMEELVALERKDIANLHPPAQRGIWICNPPYGKRLSSRAEIRSLFQTMGRVYAERFYKWRMVILCPDPELVAMTGLSMKQVGPSMAHGGLKVGVYQTGPAH